MTLLLTTSLSAGAALAQAPISKEEEARRQKAREQQQQQQQQQQRRVEPPKPPQASQGQTPPQVQQRGDQRQFLPPRGERTQQQIEQRRQEAVPQRQQQQQRVIETPRNQVAPPPTQQQLPQQTSPSTRQPGPPSTTDQRRTTSPANTGTGAPINQPVTLPNARPGNSNPTTGAPTGRTGTTSPGTGVPPVGTPNLTTTTPNTLPGNTPPNTIPPPGRPGLVNPNAVIPPAGTPNLTTTTPNTLPGNTPPNTIPPPGRPGLVNPNAVAPPVGTPAQTTTQPNTRLGTPNPTPVLRQPTGLQRLEQVKQGRVETVARSGQTVIKEPGNRTIIKQGNTTFITRNETTHFKSFVPGARTTQRGNGISETVFVRPGGARVITETDRNGNLLRRFRRDPSGREIVFVDNRRFQRNLAIGVGAALLTTAVIIALAPPVHALPREKYITEYVRASDDDIYECLTAPPVERLERTYSLDEVRYSESVRARVRRVDLDGINFELGSFEVSPDQYNKLERLARGIGRAVESNPAAVFLIEGHTDAVGSEEDNLSLSDRRAETVARILVENFNIPIENLVTQGYGQQFLKVPTSGPERQNRRVAVRAIHNLISQN